MGVFQHLVMSIELCWPRPNVSTGVTVYHAGPTAALTGVWWNVFRLVFTPVYVDVTSKYNQDREAFLRGNITTTPSRPITENELQHAPFYKALFLTNHVNYWQGEVDPVTNGIPKVLHIIESYREPTEYPFWKYINLLSMVEKIKPTMIRMQITSPLTGKWWDMAKRFVTVVQAEQVHDIFGIQVNVGAHITDYMRLKTIYEHGGIYLDSDFVMLRSLDEYLYNSTKAISVWEGGAYVGLALGTLMATKHNPFIGKWLAAYHYFNDNCWSCHSVQLGAKLAELFSSEVRGLPEIDWLMSLQRIYDPKNQNDLSTTVALHLWNSGGGNGFLVNMVGFKSFEDEMVRKTTYGRAVLQALRDSKHWGVEELPPAEK